MFTNMDFSARVNNVFARLKTNIDRNEAKPFSLGYISSRLTAEVSSTINTMYAANPMNKRKRDMLTH